MPNECYYCQRTDNLEQQIAGFWFCFWCLQRAIDTGGSHWVRLRKMLDND